MSKARKITGAVLAFGVSAVSAVALSASPAAAQESPRESGEARGMSEADADIAIVHDEGLDNNPTTDSISTLQACYDGAVSWNVGQNDGDPHNNRYIPGEDDHADAQVGRVPVYAASSRCNDVNIRIPEASAGDTQVRVCFFPSGSGYYCNQWSTIEAGDTGWNVIATSLIDGTRFEVEFQDEHDYMEGVAAY